MENQDDYQKYVVGLTEMAISNLEKDRDEALAFLDKFKDQEIGLFIRRFLDMHKTRHAVLFRTFGEVVSFSDYSFLGNLCSFVENFLLGDNCFLVEWRRYVSHDDGSIEFDENYEIKHEVVDEKTEHSYPVIVSNLDGAQNPRVLIDIIDRIQKMDEEKEEALNEFLNELQHIVKV